jgi:hypothetical protein
VRADVGPRTLFLILSRRQEMRARVRERGDACKTRLLNWNCPNTSKHPPPSWSSKSLLPTKSTLRAPRTQYTTSRRIRCTVLYALNCVRLISKGRENRKTGHAYLPPSQPYYSIESTSLNLFRNRTFSWSFFRQLTSKLFFRVNR